MTSWILPNPAKSFGAIFGHSIWHLSEN
ncbi:unnamed protein product, partial [Allacma fusca]